jgi:protein phosphatase
MTENTARATEPRAEATPAEREQPPVLRIPDLSLVALVGVSGCGKSTFARRHFLSTEVLSSDGFRALVSDDDTDQTATTDAFDALYFVAGRRLARGRLTVIDATNVQPEARKQVVRAAKEQNVLAVAIVLDVPERVCAERNRTRADRQVPPHVIPQQHAQLRRGIRELRREGFRYVHVLRSVDEVETATIVREPLWCDRRADAGPFDVIGDVHGCGDELDALLDALGYASADGVRRHPEGRRAVFVGDLVDRGPRVVHVLKTVMAMVDAGSALAVPGNHDVKLVKALRGRNVQVRHGLETSLDDLAGETPEFRAQVADFLDGLVSHYVFDGGRLVVAHAGLKEAFHGRSSGQVREFALYGDTTGEQDELGLPVRLDWAAEYRGRASVVYGHTPVGRPSWVNNTLNVDTGCVFGGALTALRWPERELVQVPALRAYAESARPFLPRHGVDVDASVVDTALDLADVTGKRIVETRLARTVTIREENAAAALEVMSRFAADPRWLVYLPPTMSPSETSALPGLLEHPAEAFAYYRGEGVETVVCQEKHMGSRAVMVVCRDAEAARRRFGVEDGDGVVYTRTGRGFFNDAALEAQALSVVRDAIGAAGLWEELATEWMVLDCELMPWSAKAQELIRDQYAAVGAAARGALGPAVDALRQAAQRGSPVDELLERYAARQGLVEAYSDAYRRYCWPVEGIDDLRLAPFHVLATEGAVHVNRDHLWHLETIARIRAAAGGRLLYPTDYRVVDLADPAAQAEATAWWEAMTARGGEGMVVKPLSFIAQGKHRLAQPAVKCRGPEYLRIIYGPEYTEPANLQRLRKRGLGGKRSLALREFALGVEGLERFVAGEPLRRVHECVFGVLALESEPVDPRL